MANDDCADCAARLADVEWQRVDRWHRTRDAALNALLRQGGTWAKGLIIADASAYADEIHGPLRP